MSSVNDATQDERIAKRPQSVDRADRSTREITDTKEASDTVRSEDRYAMLRDPNTVLPVPPTINGFHLVWLTTDNVRDSLEQRFRLGYELVKPSELPAFKFASLKGGTVSEDRIQINEMVLAKISLDLWRQDMKYLHYDRPIEEVRGLKSRVSTQVDARGKPIQTAGYNGDGGMDGYDHLARSIKSVNFANMQ